MSGRRAAWSSSRWLLIASAAAVVLCAGVPLFEAWIELSPDSTPAPRPGRFDTRTLAAVEVVLTPPQTGREPTLEGLVEGLVALKARAIPVLVAVACGEIALPEFAVGSEDEPVHPRAIELREAAVTEALRRFPPAQIAGRLRELCVGAPLEVSLVAAQLLGDCDDPSALDTLLGIARGVEPIQLQRGSVCGSIQAALAKHFARHPATIEQVEVRGPDDAWPVFVRAAGAARTTTSSRWLADLLGRNRELDLAVIEELGRSAQGGRFALPEDVIERLRNTLPRADDQMRRVAAVALGMAREAEAFDDLVSLLDETDPLIVIAARRSLTSIAGTDFGLDSGAWLDWRVAQDAWYAEHAARLVDELESADPARVSQAMSEVLAHGFFRHEWAHAIGRMAVDYSGPLFATACATLAALGSSRANNWLVEALDREDDHERELARAALATLTGLNLPAEQADWRSALEH